MAERLAGKIDAAGNFSTWFKNYRHDIIPTGNSRIIE